MHFARCTQFDLALEIVRLISMFLSARSAFFAHLEWLHLLELNLHRIRSRKMPLAVIAKHWRFIVVKALLAVKVDVHALGWLPRLAPLQWSMMWGAIWRDFQNLRRLKYLLHRLSLVYRWQPDWVLSRVLDFGRWAVSRELGAGGSGWHWHEGIIERMLSRADYVQIDWFDVLLAIFVPGRQFILLTSLPRWAFGGRGSKRHPLTWRIFAIVLRGGAWLLLLFNILAVTHVVLLRFDW